MVLSLLFLSLGQRRAVCGRRLALVSLLRRHGAELPPARRAGARRVLADDTAARTSLRATR